MEERRRHSDIVLDSLVKKTEHIELLLMGNGKVGVAEMARRAFEWMQVSKATKSGLIDWAFRIGISILLGFIAVRVGVK